MKVLAKFQVETRMRPINRQRASQISRYFQAMHSVEMLSSNKDIKTAYLNADIDEGISMQQPGGFEK